MKYIQAARIRSLSARRSLTGAPESSALADFMRPLAWFARFTMEFPAMSDHRPAAHDHLRAGSFAGPTA
jgi:hypothetical protein